MRTRVVVKKVYIPTIAFFLCIIVQLRILFVVPADHDDTTCQGKTPVTKQPPKLAVISPSEIAIAQTIHEKWLSEFKNPLIGVRLTKNITRFLTTSLNFIHNISVPYTMQQNPRNITIGILLTESGQTEKAMQSIDSLIEDNNRKDRKKYQIVIMVSFRDKDMNDRVYTELYRRYSDFCLTSLVVIIRGPADLYRQYGIPQEEDADMRKEILDYALLFLYSKRLAKFYVQMEPGIVCSKQIVKKISDIADNHKGVWFGIDFGHFGFIGTMFHSSFLQSMAEYLASRFRFENINVLLRQLYLTLSKKSISYPKSSPCLHHDLERLKSRFSFERGDYRDINKGDNPPAFINTTMAVFENYWPKNAYDNNNNTFFWAYSVDLGDNFRLIYNSSINITRIVVETGGKDGTDQLASGYLRVGGGEPPCRDLVRKGVFFNGYMDTIEQGITNFPFNINCISIDVTRKQKHWLVLRDIKVFVQRSV